MANEGLLTHAHVYVFAGVVRSGDPTQPWMSKFTCSVDDCPYKAGDNSVPAAQGMMVPEPVMKRALAQVVAGAVVDDEYTLISGGTCILCAEAGSAAELALPGTHAVTCGFRIAKLILSGNIRIVPDPGTLVDDTTSQ